LDTVSGIHVGSPGIAGFFGDTATFTGAPSTVTLDVSPTLAGMTFNVSGNTGFTISPSGNNRITLDSGSSNTAATVQVTSGVSGSHQISAPITVASGGATVTGAGTLTLSGAGNTFNGNIMVGNGGATKLIINAGSSVNSNVAQGVTAMIATGATLELDGVKSALVDNTFPTNPLYRANVVNSGSLVVGNGSISDVQQVGGIDGDGVNTPGVVVVNANASLTANHINQTSLAIGAGATFTLAPSNSNGSPMASQLAVSGAETGSLGSGLVLAGSLSPASSFVASGGSLLGAGSASSAPAVSLDGNIGKASVSAVPEPASLLLTAFGAIGFGIVAALKRARRAAACPVNQEGVLTKCS